MECLCYPYSIGADKKRPDHPNFQAARPSSIQDPWLSASRSLGIWPFLDNNAIIPALCLLVYFEDNAVLSIKIRKLSESTAAPNILQILCLYLLFLSLARITGTYINLGKSIVSSWDIL
jgi:hypothetical protein